ncbi:hypothetical protein HGRIS_014713 [Hohenbuehelia grisea]|uniref:DUF6535 domain-containing protein n=1 Tax=Hohenbuehelia grisea TaxID=104357 RepID=A0ABR3IQM8_9AGAR
MSDSAKFWSNCYKYHAEDHDREMLAEWNSNLHAIQVFAALFSSVTSAFIIQSNADLRPDPNEDVKDLLRVIANRLDNSTLPLAASPTFRPSFWAIRVNVWLLASCSLLAAFGAVLAKQWLLAYVWDAEAGSPQVRGRRRHSKYLGLRKWSVPRIIDSLPSLLIVSLLLFFIGLVDYLWAFNLIVAGVVFGFALVGALLHLVTSMIAALSPHSPFQTSFTLIFERFIQILSRHFPTYPFLQPYTTPSFLERDNFVLDAQAIFWVMKKTADETSIRIASLASLAIPGRVVSRVFLRDDIQKGVSRLLSVAHTSALACRAKLGFDPSRVENNIVMDRSAIDIANAPLRAIYHALVPIVHDAHRWALLKVDKQFHTGCLDLCSRISSLIPSPETEDLLWMIQFCIGALQDSSPDALMQSMDARLDRIEFQTGDQDSKMQTLETLVEHAALLIHVLSIDVNRPNSPGFSVRLHMARLLSWSTSSSELPPSISLWNAIAVATIPGSRTWHQESAVDHIPEPSASRGAPSSVVALNKADIISNNLFEAIQHEVATPSYSIGPAIDRLTPVLRMLNIMTRKAGFRLSKDIRRRVITILLDLVACWNHNDLHRSHAFVDVAVFFEDEETFPAAVEQWKESFGDNWRTHFSQFACTQLLSFRSTVESRRFALKALGWYLKEFGMDVSPHSANVHVWQRANSPYHAVPLRICLELADADNREAAVRCLAKGRAVWFLGPTGPAFMDAWHTTGCGNLLRGCILDSPANSDIVISSALDIFLGIVHLHRQHEGDPRIQQLVRTLLNASWIDALAASLPRRHPGDTLGHKIRACLASLWQFSVCHDLQSMFIDPAHRSSERFVFTVEYIAKHLGDMAEYCGRAFWVAHWLWTPLQVSYAWYRPHSIFDPSFTLAVENFVIQTEFLANSIVFIKDTPCAHSRIVAVADALQLFLGAFCSQILHPFEDDTALNPSDWGTVVLDRYVHELVDKVRVFFQHETPVVISPAMRSVLREIRAILLGHITQVSRKMEAVVAPLRAPSSVFTTYHPVCVGVVNETPIPYTEAIKQLGELFKSLQQLSGTAHVKVHEIAFWEKYSTEDRLDRMRQNID